MLSSLLLRSLVDYQKKPSLREKASRMIRGLCPLVFRFAIVLFQESFATSEQLHYNPYGKKRELLLRSHTALKSPTHKTAGAVGPV